MMFTPTNDPEDPIHFMDSYSSLLSPFTCFEIDGYDNIPNCYHDESVLISAGNNFAESSNNEPVSASSKMDATVNYNQGDVNGIVEQDNSRVTMNNDGSSNQNSSSRRRGASKGDRHSKIPTAQGLRDRRMRLSLDVAKQFFGLQDLLEYDKPSQTVKWLLMQAGPAIDELKQAKEARPSCTEGGGVKGMSSNSELGEEVVENTIDKKVGSDVARKATCSKEKGKHARKDAFNREAKELRKKARERARERTQKKHQAEDMRPFYKIEQHVGDETFGFGGIAQDFHWSQNCYHQEDQTGQYKPFQEFQSLGWEPYYG